MKDQKLHTKASEKYFNTLTQSSAQPKGFSVCCELSQETGIRMCLTTVWIVCDDRCQATFTSFCLLLLMLVLLVLPRTVDVLLLLLLNIILILNRISCVKAVKRVERVHDQWFILARLLLFDVNVSYISAFHVIFDFFLLPFVCRFSNSTDYLNVVFFSLVKAKEHRHKI